MQSATLLIRQVVALVVNYQLENGAVWQGSRFVEEEASLLDVRSERAHCDTVWPWPLAPQAGRLFGRAAGISIRDHGIRLCGHELEALKRRWKSNEAVEIRSRMERGPR